MSMIKAQQKIESLVRGYENDEMGIKTLHERFDTEVLDNLATLSEKQKAITLFNTLLYYVMYKGMVANC